MRIVTWNVNSVNARLERLLGFLERHQPDVLCLQELKCEREKFPWEAVKGAGYDAAVLGQKTYNGVALLYRKAPDEVTEGFGDGHADPQARAIAGRWGELVVYSLYVPNGQAVGSDKYAYKLEWLSRLHKTITSRHKPTDSVLLTGDFNIAPHDIDVHDPEAWKEQVLCSTPEREALAKLTQWGLSDLWRRHHPDEKAFSWWDYRNLGFPKNLGLRIDLLLGTSPVAERCRAALIDRDERKGKLPSDHAPVYVDLE